MGKKREPVLVDVAFAFTSDAQLNQLIADHRSAHQRTHEQVLITFRVVEK